jgi:hypothetical protein
MNAKEIIELIPEDLLSRLSAETKIDHQVKKLSGSTIFKLILFSMLGSSKVSLRVMEEFLSSATFRQLTPEAPSNSRYNSIRDRICSIKVDFFEQLFQSIFALYSRELKEEGELSKVDSTYVAISSKLLAAGMSNGGSEDKRHVKYSIQLKGSLPGSVKVFTEQQYVSEDLALSETIQHGKWLEGSVVVFDRGLQRRKSLDLFTYTSKFFVGRLRPKSKLRATDYREVPAAPEGSTITISSDTEGYLYDTPGMETAFTYRVIKGTINQSGETICLISNLMDADAYLLAQWYKQRWEIEVFFKFIKQHLNASHLVSRTENGIKVMVYMTMILATLIIVFKKKNKIAGFKIAKLRFEIELDNEIIKTIVILCGGNPDRAPHLFRSG